MQNQPIQSRLIKSVSYDAQTLVLEVELSSGKRRRFSNVSKNVYENLLTAESPGWYYTNHIRKGEPDAGSTAGNAVSAISSWLPLERMLLALRRRRRRGA